MTPLGAFLSTKHDVRFQQALDSPTPYLEKSTLVFAEPDGIIGTGPRLVETTTTSGD